MSRPIAVTNAFTTGEISPGAYGRTDLAKYNAGLTCCLNYLVDPLGGLKRRPGLRFVCETKLNQFASRIIPFQASITAAYIIEAGCQYMRFYKNGAYISTSVELVLNAGFDADISSWTTALTGSGTVAWTSTGGGAAHLASGTGAGSAALRQSITVASSTLYTVVYTIRNTVGVLKLPQVTVAIGSAAGLNDYVATTSSDGTYTYQITTTSTTMAFDFSVSTGAVGLQLQRGDVDDVSARLGGTGILEVTTPYTEGDLFNITTVQSADEQYWLNACNITRKLQHYSDTCWKFNCVPFSPPPTTEYGARPQFEMSASALTGTGITINAFNVGLNAFFAADKDREIQVITGTNAGARAGIVSVTDGQTVVAYVCVPFLTTGVNCQGTWKISGSPLTTISITDNAPVGKGSVMTLTKAGYRVGGTTAGETDVGKFILVNGGCYEITCINSTTVCRTIIRSEATNSVAGEAGNWSIEEPLWSCVRGYATTGDFFEDRLWLNSSYRFVGSKTSDYENFASGVLDDDGVQFGINSKTINTIRGIIGSRQLQLFTSGGEYVVLGGTDAPITPTNVRISGETSHGSSSVQPLRVSDVTLFLTRFGRQLREFTQRVDVVSNAYSAPDLLLLASHLTKDSSIVDLAYQKEPTPTIWAVRADGVALSCAYRREENVIAWAQHNTCGTFEAVAVIPHPDGNREQVWFIVNRIINSATKRYVEYLDDSTLIYDRRLTDCAVIYDNCSASTIFTGLGHLECATVHIQADGVYVGTCVVAQARVGIVTPAKRVEVGLPYISEAITLEPEVSFGAGSIQPMKKRWARLFLRVKDSCNMMVRTAQGQLEFVRDQRGNVMAINGVKDYDVPRLGDFLDAKVTVRQEQPLPSHLLMIGGVLDVGDA